MKKLKQSLYDVLCLLMGAWVLSGCVEEFEADIPSSDTDLLVVEGTIYPLLTRLKNEGLLAYNWIESPRGAPRKYYTLTPKGSEWLVGLNAAWSELSNTVARLKDLKVTIPENENINL